MINPTELNPKDKAAWVKALRSGKYRKGAGSLKQRLVSGKMAYCCLGVACEIGLVKADAAGTSSITEAGFVDSHWLSDQIQEALSTANDGYPTRCRITEAFNALNLPSPKLSGKSNGKKGQYAAGFKSVANWIEKNL